MFERRRPILGLLIGLTFCISIWRISVQEPSMYTNEFGYGNQLTYDDHDHRPSPTAYELKHTQPEPAAELHHHFQQQHRTNQGRYYSNEAGHHQTTPLNLNTNNNNNNYDTASSNNLSLVSFTPSSATASLLFDYESLPADDFTTLIDFKDFKFLINQAPCARTNTAYFLILVHSAPSNYEKRQVIRETWGSVQSPHLRLLFLVGGVQTNQLQKTLDAENAKFSDLIQGNFVDDYRNMTYKHVMALKWFIYLCPKAKFLIKTDDDVFVNTLQLLEYVELQRLQQHRPILSLFTPRTYHVPNSSSTHNTSHILNVLQSTNFLFCQRQAEARVKRSYRSKWRVSTKEYAGRYYPPYCPGYSIMYSPDVVFRLYKEAQRSKYFWIDDVHITGTLAQNSNITITSFWPWRIHPKAYDDILNGKTDIGQYLFFFAWANISERQIRDLWTMTFGHFNSTRWNDGGGGGGGGVGAYKYNSFR